MPGQLVLFLISIPAAQIAPTVALAAAYGIIDHSNLGVNARPVEGVLVTGVASPAPRSDDGQEHDVRDDEVPHRSSP